MSSGTEGSTNVESGPGGYYRSWSGDDGRYERYKGKLRDKWNNYTCYIVRQYGTPSSHPQKYYINISGKPNWSKLWTTQEEAELQSRLVSKVRGHEFNMAVEAAQGGQTVSMVVSTLTSLGRAVRAAKRGDLRKACYALSVQPRKQKFTSRDISGRWLELQYGWLPMLSSVYEACSAYAAINERRRSVVVAKKSISGRYNGAQSPNYSGMGTWRYRKRIQYEMTEKLSVARSLGLLDPLSVAWELIPFSFVIDWFIPIGTWLDNLSVIPFLEGRSLTTITRTCDANGQGKATSIYYRGATSEYHLVQVDRSKSVGLSTARPWFKPLPDTMSPKRIFNAIALAHQEVRN